MEDLKPFLSVLLEIACYLFFLDIFLEKQNKKIHEYMFWFGAAVLLYAVNHLFNNVVVNVCIYITVITLGNRLLYRMPIRSAFVLSGLLIAMLSISDLITYWICQYILNVEIRSEAFAGTLAVLMSKCVLLVLVILCRYYSFQYSLYQYLRNRRCSDMIPIVFPLLSMVFIGVLLKDRFRVLLQVQGNLLWIFIFLVTVINVFMLIYMQDMDKRNALQQENYLLELDRKTQKALYQTMERGLEKQRELSHDYKNHMLCIHTMLTQENYSEAKAYLEKISGIVSRNFDKINTNHPVVNAIVNAKYQEAVEKGILVVCKVNDLSQITMEESDIVLVLSNVFNNAIEACEQCSGKKVLKFKMIMEQGNWICSIQNSYIGVVRKRGDSFLTTKNNAGGVHGIGLKNIVKTIEKYNGFYNISYNSEEFHIFIEIPQGNR